MNDDAVKTQEKEPEAGILLIGAEDNYWLLSGEDYLSAMLSGEEYFPKPVIYHEYDSLFELQLSLEEGLILNSLWGIHPGIIGRLKREEHIKIERR